MNKCNIKINLEFGSIDSRFMNVEYKIDSTVKKVSVTKNHGLIDDDVFLPGKISLIFSNKNHSSDTIVNESNQIVADLYVKILDIKLENFDIPQIYIQKNLCLVTESKHEINTSYIGFNGIMEIALDKNSVFQQINWFKKMSK